MTNWKCTQCGRVHSRNPSGCAECGHSVLQQTEESAEGWLARILPWR